jgi:hypothetical protein
MGLLDVKAAAAKARTHRKPMGSGPGNASGRTGLPGPPGGVVARAKVRDQATIRTSPPGFELGLELLEAIARWPEDLRDLWDERAAILEYDAGEPRPVAERRAYEIVRTAREAALLMAEPKQ